jgi:hypothetical protein
MMCQRSERSESPAQQKPERAWETERGKERLVRKEKERG